MKKRFIKLPGGGITWQPKDIPPPLDSNLCRAVLKIIERQPGISSDQIAIMLQRAGIRWARSKLALHTLLRAGKIRRDHEQSSYYMTTKGAPRC